MDTKDTIVHISMTLVLMLTVGLASAFGQGQQPPVSARQAEALQDTCKQSPVSVSLRGVEVADDSVRISLSFLFDSLAVPSTRKLVLTPVLRRGSRELALPPVILSGRRRLMDDRRAWNVNPHLIPLPLPYTIIEAPGHRQPYTARHSYDYAIPYASWMRNAELLIEEREHDCCDNRLLAFRLIDDDLGLPDPCVIVRQDTIFITHTEPDNQDDTVSPPVEPEEVPLCVECTVIYIEFPQGKFDVRPGFRSNQAELAKVDSVMSHLPGRRCVLHICGFASPEGILMDNEILSRNRTESFAAYIKRHYRLPPHCTIETTSVGEDWDGLVELLRRTGKPYAPASLAIIRSLGVLEGRERRLMDLERGDPYRDMLRTLFPYLRRIEMSVRIIE